MCCCCVWEKKKLVVVLSDGGASYSLLNYLACAPARRPPRRYLTSVGEIGDIYFSTQHSIPHDIRYELAINIPIQQVNLFFFLSLSRAANCQLLLKYFYDEGAANIPIL